MKNEMKICIHRLCLEQNKGAIKMSSLNDFGTLFCIPSNIAYL